ncbi:MAG: class I SAM-dependent methyltransferase [Candidatus Woesearchaeota archaeon]
MNTTKETKTDTYYNGLADGYNRLYGHEQRQKLEKAKQEILPLLDKNAIASVLDVGCGTGISTDFWSEVFGIKAVGIDPAIALLKQNSQTKSILQPGSAEELDFADSSFDLVVSFSAIQNFTDVQKGLHEIHRVGKQYFILSVMNRGSSFPNIREYIKETFTLRLEFDCVNDTIFFCEKK